MNINEIVKRENENKRYITKYKGEEMIVDVIKCHGDTYDLVKIIRDDENGYMNRHLFEFMYMSEILELEFEEFIDWNKIPIDTKVLVSNNGNSWHKRYFATYEDGAFYAWEIGKSSRDVYRPIEEYMVRWKYCKLYEE